MKIINRSLILLVVSLTGCTLASPFHPTPPLRQASEFATQTVLPTKEATKTTEPQDTTTVPLPTGALENTSTPSLECLPPKSLVAQPPTMETPRGNALLLRKPSAPYEPYLYYPDSGIEEPFVDKYVFQMYVSPDQKRIAYVFGPLSNMSSDKLVVKDTNNRIIKIFPWKKEWTFFWGWMDNDHLMVTKRAPEGKWTASLVVLGLNDNSETELRSDYPDFNNTFEPQWQHNFVIYDPTLSFGVYPTSDQPNTFALYDIRNQRFLARLPNDFNHISQPVWSPDGSVVLESATKPVKRVGARFEENFQELFLLDKNGNITQITHFIDENKYGWFWGYSWSPDGQTVAFWFTPVDGKQNQLGFVNLKTMKVTNYCVYDDLVGFPNTPIWSPDSKIAVVSLMNDTGEPTRMVWINVETTFGAYWDKEARLVGWVTIPEK